MELLEQNEEETGLENITLDRVQTVAHSFEQALGTAEYQGEEYQLTATDKGDVIALRASSGEEVYSVNVDHQGFGYTEDWFTEIFEETDLMLAYSGELEYNDNLQTAI